MIVCVADQRFNGVMTGKQNAVRDARGAHLTVIGGGTADPSLPPPEESLVQAQVPLRPGESTASGISRVEELLDLGLPQWRDRLTWRRDSIARGRTGAIDYPGRSWRDRPAIDRGNGIYLAGDQVAAAGLLSEVSFNSAMRAVDLALVRATEMAPA